MCKPPTIVTKGSEPPVPSSESYTPDTSAESHSGGMLQVAGSSSTTCPVEPVLTEEASNSLTPKDSSLEIDNAVLLTTPNQSDG